MTAEERLKELFSQALERKSPAELENFLAEACKDQPELRSQVESLLRAHEQAGDFLGQTMQLPPTVFEPEPVGTIIGRYKLLEKIGEGGFGVVYMAEQQEPVQRKVALKIIKAGMDTREVIARFEAERQALALMEHPNIARVLDGGATAAGRPFFVMELVRGIPITEYCDQNDLSTIGRLLLFIKVCQAVQHAHQKAVIHRDLKPSNILVTLHDGEPVPKVIDFGVAKALGQKLTEKTLFTAFRQMIGTPAYMSPEQAEMSGLDIDTRSDIYSLGVLLYELLTGVTPFDRDTLAKAALDEIRRIILETEPPKPSTRLRSLGDKLPQVAKHRRTEPAALSRLVRGDLDWIVMKCLEKDRTRRYETANGLARDIQRHLNNEPVTAAAPTAVYRAQKFIRRHKVGLGAATTLMLLLAAGTIVSSWQALRARRAERHAHNEGAKSEQVAQFLQEMLKGVGPSVALGRDTRMLREILDRTTERVGTDLTNQPEVEAELRTTIGGIYQSLALFEKAEAMHQRALQIRRNLLPGEHPEIARCLNNLAITLLSEGAYAGAETMHREALAMRRKLFGDHHPEVADSLNNLALAIQKRGQLTEAEAMFRQALAIRLEATGGKENLPLASALANLAGALRDQNKLDRAETMYRQALAIRKRLLSDDHPDVSATLVGLVRVLRDQGKLDQAELTQREVLEVQRRLFGNEHPAVANSLKDLARVLQRQGKLAEIEALFREEIVLARNRYPNYPHERSDTIYPLMDVLLSQHEFAAAERVADTLLTPALESQPQNVGLLINRGHYFARRGRWKEAAADFARVIEADPSHHDAWYLLAPLLVESQALEDYQRHRHRMLMRFGATANPMIAERTAKACLLVSGSGADLEAAANLAELAVTGTTNHPYLPFLQLAKGLAEFRQGHYTRAQEWLGSSLSHGWDDRNLVAPGSILIALTHQKLAQTVEARLALAKVPAIAIGDWPVSSGGDVGPDWNDWLIAQILMREAKALVEGQGGLPSSQSKEK